MKRFQFFAIAALAVGMAAPATLSAQDWRDLHHDYARSDRMSDDMARDQARLNEDIRCGRTEAAAEDARDLARDQRAYASQQSDIQRDQYRSPYGDRYYNRSNDGYNNGYNGYGNGYNSYGNGYNGYGNNSYGNGYYRNYSRHDWR